MLSSPARENLFTMSLAPLAISCCREMRLSSAQPINVLLRRARSNFVRGSWHVYCFGELHARRYTHNARAHFA